MPQWIEYEPGKLFFRTRQTLGMAGIITDMREGGKERWDERRGDGWQAVEINDRGRRYLMFLKYPCLIG